MQGAPLEATPPTIFNGRYWTISDNETIGILICGSKNDRSVRYGLGRATSPMAVAAYTYEALPDDVRQDYPTPST